MAIKKYIKKYRGKKIGFIRRKPYLFHVGKFTTSFSKYLNAARKTYLPLYKVKKVRDFIGSKKFNFRSELEFRKSAKTIRRLRGALFLRGLPGETTLGIRLKKGAKPSKSLKFIKKFLSSIHFTPRKYLDLIGKRRGVIGGGIQWWKNSLETIVEKFKPRLKLLEKRKKKSLLLTEESIKLPEFKRVALYRIVLTRTLNNIFASGIRVNDGAVFEVVSAGTVGLSGPKKTSNLSAEKIGNTIAIKFLQLGVSIADIAIKSPIIDKFIKSAVLGIVGAKVRRLYRIGYKQKVSRVNLGVRNVLLDVGKAHNGIRLPKQRRV